MADKVSVEVEVAELLAALDRVPDAVHAHLKTVDRITANRIALEAHARVARRTGKTAAAITVEETYNHEGYVVFVGEERRLIGRFLEFGTKFIPAQPFLFASARLEAAAHDFRARQAVQDAIDEQGLGDLIGVEI